MAKWFSRDCIEGWILLTGDRYAVSACLLGLVTVLFVLVGIGSVLNELSPLFYLYGGLVGGNITLITIVVSINQLVLLREFGTPDELRTEIRETTSYRQRATDPAGGNADNSFHRSLDQLRSSLLEHAERVDTRLSDDDSDLFDVVVAVLRARYGDRIQSVRRIQSVHEDDLSSGLNDVLDSIVMSLEDLDIARHYLLTIYVRHELSRLSRVLVYAGIPAVTISGAMLVHLTGYSQPPPTTLAPFGLIVLTLVIGLLPLALLGSFVARIALVTQYVSITPFEMP